MAKPQQFVWRGPEHLIDGAHIGKLQPKAELDSEESKDHIPYLPEAAPWSLHGAPS